MASRCLTTTCNRVQDRCPICKGLVPEVKKAAINTMAEFPGQIAFGAVNSRVYQDIADKWGITSYPWVTSFYKGEKVSTVDIRWPPATLATASLAPRSARPPPALRPH